MSDTKQHTACIIGGGMSGLFTGALLAKNGYKVTVLEKNHIIGGGLQSFRRGDAVFNTGLQAFCGYDKDFALYHLFNYLGFDKESLHMTPLDKKAQEIVWIDSIHCYHLPKTRQKYEAYLIAQFPHQAQGIHDLLNDIYEIGGTFDYFWLQPMQSHPEIIKYTSLTAMQLICKYISDDRLIKLLGYTSIHIGHNLAKASAIELGMIMTLYIEGSWRFNGGNVDFAQLLADLIQNNGGQVLNDVEVGKLHGLNRRIEWVETTSGTQYKADIFVSSISPHLLLSMTDSVIFRPAAELRVKTFCNEFSGYTIFVKFKDKSFPYCNSSIFVPLEIQDDVLPQYINVITPSVCNQDEWARTMEINVPCRYEMFTQWENTLTGCRNNIQYEKFKEKLAKNIVTYVSRFIPGLTDAIDVIYSGTPLTFRDYYGNLKGATYSQQGLFLPIKTRMDNLFLTGQSVMYQGLFGVATTSILSAETVLKRNLINEIAKS